jgi:hypothetical protein
MASASVQATADPFAHLNVSAATLGDKYRGAVVEVRMRDLLMLTIRTNELRDRISNFRQLSLCPVMKPFHEQ